MDVYLTNRDVKTIYGIEDRGLLFIQRTLLWTFDLLKSSLYEIVMA